MENVAGRPVRNRLRIFGNRVKMLWIMVGLSLVLYGSVEMFFYLILKTCVRSVPVIDVDLMASADTYAGAPWARQVCQEAENVRNNWEPFVYFSPKAHASDVLNIDERGLRRTLHETVAPSGSSTLTIKFFGGSTMFGYGARDDYTIASCVARQLRQESIENVVITNHGRIAYVSRQSVLLLVEELMRGRIPDIVVFYDGVNDVESAMLGLRAGVTYNEGRLAQAMEPRDDSAFGAVKLFFGRSPTVRVTTAFKRRNLEPEVEVALRAADTDRLAAEVAEAYFRNVAFVRELGVIYGFDCLFYWQPTMYQKPQLTAFEQSLFERPWYEGLPKTGSEQITGFYRKAYAAVRVAGGPHNDFRDISGLFAQDATPRYIDPQHLAESGNEVVARSMLADIRPLIEERNRERN